MTATQNANSPRSGSLLSSLLQSTATGSTGFQITWAVLRVVVSLLMIHNGLDKLADVDGFATNVVAKIGFPYPVFFTYCAAYTELIGSILLALGVFTRLNAAFLLLTMIVAVYFHLKVDGLKIPPLETASLYATAFLFFCINGGGTFSVDTILAKLMQRQS
jgi:putative oxidoreductase